MTIDGRAMLDHVLLLDDNASVGKIGPVTIGNVVLFVDQLALSIVNSRQLTALRKEMHF